MILPSYKYGNPETVAIQKENAIENRVRNCQGCANLNFDASGDKIIANCFKGYKVGRKDVSKCHSERLKQDCKGAK